MTSYLPKKHSVSCIKLWLKSTKVFAVVGVVALLSAPNHVALAQKQEDVIETGRQQFNEKCVICHGLNAKGDGRLAEHLTDQPPDLTQLSKKNGGTFPFWTTYTKIDGREVETISTHGTSEMPVWGSDELAEESGGSLPMAQIFAIVTYLESIQEE
jgi:mono/diheme cytochrome c family protein